MGGGGPNDPPLPLGKFVTVNSLVVRGLKVWIIHIQGQILFVCFVAHPSSLNIFGGPPRSARIISWSPHIPFDPPSRNFLTGPLCVKLVCSHGNDVSSDMAAQLYSKSQSKTVLCKIPIKGMLHRGSTHLNRSNCGYERSGSIGANWALNVSTV